MRATSRVMVTGRQAITGERWNIAAVPVFNTCMTDVQSDTQKLERVTVALVPKASQALSDVTIREHLSKTDVINRSVQLYEFVSRLMANGSDVLVRTKSGEILGVVLF